MFLGCFAIASMIVSGTSPGGLVALAVMALRDTIGLASVEPATQTAGEQDGASDYRVMR